MFSDHVILFFLSLLCNKSFVKCLTKYICFTLSLITALFRHSVFVHVVCLVDHLLQLVVLQQAEPAEVG